MKVGINFLLWTIHVEEKHFFLFKQLKKCGYDGVEIPLTFGNEKHYQKVQQAIYNEGLKCTTTSSCSPDKNIISANASIRQAGLDHIKWAIDMNYILESKMLGGPLHSSPGIFSGSAATKQEIQWATKNLLQASKYAAKANITITIEFLNRFECYLVNTVEQSLNLVNMVNQPNFGIHYDTHHAHYEECNIASAIKTGNNAIKHIHYSENNRGIPGKGLVDWNTTTKTLKEIGYNGWITIEAFSTKVNILKQALHRWRELFLDEEECYKTSINFIHNQWN